MMKKFLLTILLLMICSMRTFGQIYVVPERTFAPSNMSMYCLGIYKVGSDDFFHYESYSMPEYITGSDYIKISKGDERFFCYSKDAKRYYFYTDNLVGFYYPKDKDVEKNLKKNMKDNNVKNIKIEDLPLFLDEILKQMDDVFSIKNNTIAEEKRILREKQIQDSILTAQKKMAEMDEYRRTHDWRELELLTGYVLDCGFCGAGHYQKKFKLMSLSADTIYYVLDKPDLSLLGINHFAIHYSALTPKIKNDRKFEEHVNMWSDSIAKYNNVKNQDADIINLLQYNEFKQKVCNTAPIGFIKEWGWELNTADGIEPYFTFFNTSKKTIKYVDFYFSVFNPVGDRCYLRYNKSYIGNVRGVGPVDSFEYGKWSWDRATHYTSSDASDMRIIKLVITYMDGTTKTIPRDLILYE